MNARWVPLFVALGVLGLVSLVACWLLATWTGDDRWASTAVLAMFVGIPSLGFAAYLRSQR